MAIKSQKKKFNEYFKSKKKIEEESTKFEHTGCCILKSNKVINSNLVKVI